MVAYNSLIYGNGKSIILWVHLFCGNKKGHKSSIFVHIIVESTWLQGETWWNNWKPPWKPQQLSGIKSRFLRSGEVMLHTGFFRKCTSSCHTYCPGAGVLSLFRRFGALAVPSASKAWEGVLWTESSTKTKLSSSFAFRRPMAGFFIYERLLACNRPNCWSRKRPQGDSGK